MITILKPSSKAAAGKPLAIVLEKEHGERYGLPYLYRQMKEGDKPKPGVLFDAEGKPHMISHGLLKKVALVGDPCLRISERAYRRFGYRMNSACSPYYCGEKTFQREAAKGIVDQPQWKFVILPPPFVPVPSIGMNSRKTWEFMLELPEFYAKPNLGGGGACIFKLEKNGGKYILRSSDGEDSLGYIADVFGKKAIRASPGLLELEIGSVSDMKRLFMKGMKWSTYLAGSMIMIVESCIPALKYDGRNVDFRFILLKEEGSFVPAADYAKVGNGFVSNISKGGHGESTPGVIASILSEAASKGQIRLLGPVADAAERMETRMRGIAAKVADEYIGRMRKANQTSGLKGVLFGNYTPEHMINPLMLAPDFMIGVKDGEAVPYLVEINDGNIGLSGLEAVDKKAHGALVAKHTRLVVEEYEKAASRFVHE